MRLEKATARYRQHFAQMARQRVKNARLAREGQERRAAVAARKAAGPSGATDGPACETQSMAQMTGQESQ